MLVTNCIPLCLNPMFTHITVIFPDNNVTFCIFAADGQKQETTLGGGSSRHCFNNLKPNTQYKMSVYAQLLDGTEGPAVTAIEKTRKAHARTRVHVHIHSSYIHLQSRTEVQCVSKKCKLSFRSEIWKHA